MVKNVSMTRKEFLTARKQVFREVHGLQSLTDVTDSFFGAGKDLSAEASEWHLSKVNLILDRKKASTAKKCCL